MRYIDQYCVVLCHEKKVLALVLAFACAFTMFAGAASFTDQADINTDNVEAVDLLTTLGIIKGYEDGSFDPEGTVDRAEMAKMIYTIRNGGNDDASAHVGNTTSFTDISGHWAEGYIKYLQNTGIVAGKSATQFAPDAQVTTAEAMKMALALAGYDEENAGLTGIDWQKNTLTYATTIGLTDNVASAMSAGCTRQDAAQILANCLGATAVRYSAVVENFVNDSKEGLSFGGPAISVGNKWMDLYTNIGTLIGIDGDALTITMTQSDEADSDAPSIKEFIDLDTDYSELLGQKVKVLFEGGKNNSVIGVYATVDNTVYTVEANDTSKDEEKVAFGGNSYRLDDEGGITTYIDGDKNAQWTSLDELDHNTLNPNMYTFVDTDDNGRLDTLVVRTYDVAKVSYVASDRVIAAGQTYKYDDEIIADGIEKDDWVVITHDMYNDCWNIEPVEVQSADLDAMRNDKSGSMYFDGQELKNVNNYDEYQIGDNWYAGGDDAVQSARSENDLKNVKAVQAVDYVAVNGIMFYIERSSGTNTGRVDNVAVVLAETGHNAVAEQARIAFFNGDTKVVDIEDKSVDIEVGKAYEYTVIGDEYRFSELEAGIEGRNADWEDYEEYYGDLTFRGDVKAVVNDLNNGRFDGVKIDDNAQVLLYWAEDGRDADWDVVSITGKKFNDINDVENLLNGKGVVAGAAAYGFSGDMGGLNRIGALALQVDEGLDLSEIGIPTWNHYGYILTNAKWVNRNNGIAEYQLFTDGYIYNVQEEIDDLSERQKNTVLGYDELTGDGVVVRAVVENVEEGTYGIEGAVVLDHNDGGLVFSAITTVSDNGNTVIMSNGDEMDISDATIIYVDSKNGAAITEGDVKVALKNYDLNGNPYMANALYIGQNNSDCELLVVDQGLYLESDYYDDVLGISGDNTVYGKDTANDGADEDVMDYVSASNWRVNSYGDLTFNITIDQPEWATDDATYTVEYKVYGDGELIDTYTAEDRNNNDDLASGSTRITNMKADFSVYDEIDVELTEMTASKVKVRYFDGDEQINQSALDTLAVAELTTGDATVMKIKTAATNGWLLGQTNASADFTIDGAISGNAVTGSVTGITKADGTQNDSQTLGTVTATGKGYVDVTFTNVKSDGAVYTFTGLNNESMVQFGADETETAKLTINPANQTINGGTSLNLTAQLSATPTAADEYVVTVKVGSQTLSWTLGDTNVSASKALTINGDVKLDATNVTVTAVDKPEMETSNSKPVINLTQENGKYVYVIDFDMNIELADSSKISATEKTGESANIVNSVRVEDNKLYVILNGTMGDGATISVNAGAVCDANDSSNTNDAQTLVYSSADRSWGFQA